MKQNAQATQYMLLGVFNNKKIENESKPSEFNYLIDDYFDVLHMYYTCKCKTFSYCLLIINLQIIIDTNLSITQNMKKICREMFRLFLCTFSM